MGVETRYKPVKLTFVSP